MTAMWFWNWGYIGEIEEAISGQYMTKLEIVVIYSKIWFYIAIFLNLVYFFGGFLLSIFSLSLSTNVLQNQKRWKTIMKFEHQEKSTGEIISYQSYNKHGCNKLGQNHENIEPLFYWYLLFVSCQQIFIGVSHIGLFDYIIFWLFGYLVIQLFNHLII